MISVALERLFSRQKRKPYVHVLVMYCCAFSRRVGYQLTNCVEYNHPIYGFYQTDLDRDGVKEVVVCGQFECYLLQPKPPETKRRLNDMLRLMDDVLLMEDQLHSLDG